MKKFSSAIKRIGTESAFTVGPEIEKFEKKGFDIIRLNIGEPGGNIPRKSTKAAVASFEKHETHYTPSKGSESLRTEIAKYMTITRNVRYIADDIVVCPGGKPVIAGAIFIFVDPADEVIYPTPGYPIYESIIDFVGAKKVPITLQEEKGFRFDLKDFKKLVSKRTKLLIINSPSNPTGGVLEKEDVREIAKLARKYGFYVLSDECYSRLAFSNKFRKVVYKNNRFVITPSIAGETEMGDKTVVLDAFSKTYAMTGLRLGWVASKNKKFIGKFLTYAINFWSCLPAPIMAAGEAALGRDQTQAQKDIKDYEKKKDIAVKMLNSINGINCHDPVGSFYLFPNVTGVCKKLGLKNADEFRKYLLTYDKKSKKGVAVLARIHFGEKLAGENQEYIRISFAGRLTDIKEGIRRIKKAVERL